ncbi:hypothetical protein BDDG_12938 [Blastomyces dermatitidis ATCC 18188]|uniref:Uncharacterized protein n=1 Tax=Ajellomyces dermatitidis (strain ATCC 18188 / CBS 674.68) TaxID=653446 RepID=A0A0J9ETZ9_AJEDA|nr:hypothetical protein BDDG_12938 [Blastomyces dermatitidis ATCC 18188]
MSSKKKLTAVKTGAVSMMKKTLILEKLFQSLSQKKYNILLHISDREEKMNEKTNKEKIDKNEMKENNEDKELEFQIESESEIFNSDNFRDKLLILSTYLFTYKVIKDQDKENTVMSYHHSARLHDTVTEESTDELYDRSLKSQEESKIMI